MPNKGKATLLLQDHAANVADIAVIGAKTTGKVVGVEAGGVSVLVALLPVGTTTNLTMQSLSVELDIQSLFPLLKELDPWKAPNKREASRTRCNPASLLDCKDMMAQLYIDGNKVCDTTYPCCTGKSFASR
jgi:hypothetical protein